MPGMMGELPRAAALTQATDFLEVIKLAGSPDVQAALAEMKALRDDIDTKLQAVQQGEIANRTTAEALATAQAQLASDQAGLAADLRQLASDQSAVVATKRAAADTLATARATAQEIENSADASRTQAAALLESAQAKNDAADAALASANAASDAANTLKADYEGRLAKLRGLAA